MVGNEGGELQRATARNDMNVFFSELKGFSDEMTCTSDIIRWEGEGGTSYNNVIARWSEYFQKLLNVARDIEPEAMENIKQHMVNTVLDEQPTMNEMVKAMRSRD